MGKRREPLCSPKPGRAKGIHDGHGQRRRSGGRDLFGAGVPPAPSVCCARGMRIVGPARLDQATGKPFHLKRCDRCGYLVRFFPRHTKLTSPADTPLPLPPLSRRKPRPGSMVWIRMGVVTRRR